MAPRPLFPGENVSARSSPDSLLHLATATVLLLTRGPGQRFAFILQSSQGSVISQAVGYPVSEDCGAVEGGCLSSWTSICLDLQRIVGKWPLSSHFDLGIACVNLSQWTHFFLPEDLPWRRKSKLWSRNLENKPRDPLGLETPTAKWV